MVLLIDFPLEVIQRTIATLSGDFNSLVSCCLVCRTFNQATTPILYAHIDLHIEYNGATETGMAKQQLFLSSIAKNSKKAKCIKQFWNNSTAIGDATNNCERAVLVDAARNMTSLRQAYLGKNVLSAAIITSLHSYPELTDLVVQGLNPGWFTWTPKPTNLRSLTWIEPVPRAEEYPHEYEGASLKYLINVIESSCPLLESISLHFEPGGKLSEAYSDDLRFLCNRPERSILYIEKSDFTGSLNREIPRLALNRLQHFGIRDAYGMQHQYRYTELMQKFVRDHEQTLTSLSIPIGTIRTRKELDFILSMSEYIPNLKNLALGRDGDWGIGPIMEAERFLSILITNLAPPGNFIESFTMMDIGTFFTKEIGRIFQSWKGLKFLHLGDCDNTNGQYDNNGTIDLDSYDLITFIKELPPTLEELAIDVNGEGLFFDGDFDKICSLGNSIFTSLKRLKSCDLCIWISDMEMTMKDMPEKAIHWRRLAHIENQIPNMRMRDIWTSRMELNPLGNQPLIAHECAIATLDDGDGYFEGDDAVEVWMDGTKNQRDARNAWTRQREEMHDAEIQKSWPINYNDFKSYALYSRSLRRNPFGPYSGYKSLRYGRA